MNSIIIQNLVGLSLTRLHLCWCQAFSDYKYPLAVPLAELDVRLRQDSYDPALSVGAFHNNNLVGFWLSGSRIVGGKKVAYDAGTAVVPDWRGKGVSNVLADEVENVVATSGASEYVLEVFDDNRQALGLYTNRGFQRNRLLDGYRLSSFSTLEESDVKVTRKNLDELEREAQSLLDYEPSWQNSWPALRAVAESTVPITVEQDGTLVAYGIFQPILGRIAQIGVHATAGDKSRLVAAIIMECYKHMGGKGKLEIVNLPREVGTVPDLLTKLGFEHFITLVEMKKIFAADQ